ncbi:MAG: hypothetical protein C0467_02655 [Planctomycetaceae bacterium]|nr:hypothetical protein [Planctomycetaceae bacterium]
MNVRIGDVGRAVSALSPSGYVEIDGVRRSARSEGTYIDAGRDVIVVRGEMPSFIVREIEPGIPLPRFPNHGTTIEKSEHQRNSADVAVSEQEEQRLAWKQLKRRMRIGAAASGAFGLLVGLANAALGGHYNWASVNETIQLPLLHAGSAAIGTAAAIVLYFFTGWFVTHILPAEADAVFEPSFLAILAGLVGAALGFWMNFASGDVNTIALWSAGVSFAFAAVVCGVSWVVTLARG